MKLDRRTFSEPERNTNFYGGALITVPISISQLEMKGEEDEKEAVANLISYIYV